MTSSLGRCPAALSELDAWVHVNFDSDDKNHEDENDHDLVGDDGGGYFDDADAGDDGEECNKKGKRRRGRDYESCSCSFHY